MNKYILGEVEIIGKERHIERVYKIPNTPIEINLYKKSFYNWACKQTTENLDNWKQYSIKCFEHVPGHRESIEWELEYDLLLESLEKFPTFQQYYNHSVKVEINHSVEFVEGLLLFDKNLLDHKEKLYIYNVVQLCFYLDHRVSRLIRFNSIPKAPKIIIDNERLLVDKLYEDVHRGTDTKTMEIFSRIIDDMKEKQIVLKNSTGNKKKKKELQEKLQRIEAYCNAIEIGGAPREDIYRKNKRLAGAGWSKQK
jgi:hypothetical protein